MARAGQRDLGKARLTRHALERFVERFGGEPDEADGSLRAALARTRRLGTNPDNEAVAVLAMHQGKVLVAIFQGTTCLTVLPDLGRSSSLGCPSSVGSDCPGNAGGCSGGWSIPTPDPLRKPEGRKRPGPGQ